MTNATDKLRRLLDERGVEWYEPAQMEGSVFTRWNSDGVSWTASMVHGRDNALRIGASTVTSEQAIAATLGSGMCKVESKFWHDHGGYDSDTYEFVLSCGHSVEWLDSKPPRHCPDCGKKVER